MHASSNREGIDCTSHNKHKYHTLNSGPSKMTSSGKYATTGEPTDANAAQTIKRIKKSNKKDGDASSARTHAAVRMAVRKPCSPESPFFENAATRRHCRIGMQGLVTSRHVGNTPACVAVVMCSSDSGNGGLKTVLTQRKRAVLV